MKRVTVAVIVSFSLAAAAQNTQPAPPHVPGPMGQMIQSVPPAPGANPSVLLQRDVKARLDAMISAAKVAGSSSATLVDYGSYKLQLSVRTQSGGAEIHAHWDDVMVVEAGSATLVTGGAVIDGSTSTDGETHGTKIEGGQTQSLNPGDMVTIRAGTPHQIHIDPGTIYEALVVKIHEP
jgi:mannose-6-phosphate isomerase-like protein (cupin superfamily)